MANAASERCSAAEPSCPVCLQQCSDPVTLGCQHRFCRSCIQGSGSGCQPLPCPECRADTADCVAPGRAASSVLCSYCSRTARPAVKTCLQCEASMCPVHLRIHTFSRVFQSHPLVETAADLSRWKCTEHHRLLEIYCRDDQVCVCTLCTVIGKHRNHRCGSISEGEQELRDNLQLQLKTIEKNVASVQAALGDLHTQKLSTQSLITETKREVKEKYNALRKHIENEERDVFLCLDKEQSRVTAAIDTHIHRLEKEIHFFQTCLVNLTDLSHKSEKLAFIQVRGELNASLLRQDPCHSFLNSLLPNYHRFAQKVRAVKTLACEGEQMSCCITGLAGFNSMVTRIKNASEPFTSPQPRPSVDKIKLDKIKNHTQRNLELVSQVKRDRDRLISLYGQRLTPDLNTAHTQFVLSDGHRTVSLSAKRQPLPRNAERFDCCQQLLCVEGVRAGRSYWEVEVVGDSGVWKVGLCYRTIGRRGKGADCLLGRNRVSWCLYSLVGSVLALHDDNDTKLTVGNISRVGVYVDFEAGTILFYSVSDRKLTLIHTFHQEAFTEALYPALQIGDFTTSLTLCTLK